jgi:hypothetical protein
VNFLIKGTIFLVVDHDRKWNDLRAPRGLKIVSIDGWHTILGFPGFFTDFDFYNHMHCAVCLLSYADMQSSELRFPSYYLNLNARGRALNSTVLVAILGLVNRHFFL